jgi:methyl-accepting chemotaxis protein
VRSYRNRSLLIFLITLVAVSLAGFTLVRRSIITPLNRAVAMARAIEKGNLSVKINSDSQDEIGQLLNSIEGMRHGLSGMVGSISASVLELGGATRQLGGDIQNVRERAQYVCETSKDAGKDLSDIERKSETVGVQVAQANKAVQEMSVTLANVSETCASNSAVTQKAKIDADAALEIMATLGTAAGEIKKVLSLLGEIVKKTQFLAFNATIESARAGEAGNGFAVVADEIRKLASESESSQGIIKKAVDHIVAKTTEAGRNIEAISKTITEVNDRSQSVSTLVLQQNTIVGGVSKNLEVVSQDTNDMVGMIRSANSGLEVIGRKSQEVFNSLESTTAAISASQGNKQSLEGIAGNLDQLIGKFKS